MADHSSDARPTPEMAPLQESLHDAVALFSRLAIPYALIGGLAAMRYGRLRATEDVDFVAAAGHQDILAAHPDLMRACRFDPARTRKLYHQTGVQMDIWKDEFSDQIAARAQEVQLGDQTVRIAEVHDLVAMKLRAARLQDDYDISEILKNTPIDEAVLRPRITSAQFAHFQSIRQRTPS